MRIQVLICRCDGRQEIVEREVAEDWFPVLEVSPEKT